MNTTPSALRSMPLTDAERTYLHTLSAAADWAARRVDTLTATAATLGAPGSPVDFPAEEEAALAFCGISPAAARRTRILNRDHAAAALATGLERHALAEARYVLAVTLFSERHAVTAAGALVDALDADPFSTEAERDAAADALDAQQTRDTLADRVYALATLAPRSPVPYLDAVPVTEAVIADTLTAAVAAGVCTDALAATVTLHALAVIGGTR